MSAPTDEIEALLTAAFGCDKPRPRPEGADLLTARDRQAIRDVGLDCGEAIADAFELGLIRDRRRDDASKRADGRPS